MNDALGKLHKRIESKQKFQGGVPPAVLGFDVEGRLGGFRLRWTPIESTSGTGYLIVMAKDSTMRQIDGRFPLADVTANTFFVYLGNSAEVRYFQIYSINGEILSQPSQVESATIVTTGTPDAAPTDPPVWATVPVSGRGESL